MSGHEQHFRNFLFCLADDEFVLGHRNSEWTGLGPIMEEDIAFSSMAQDELGHALGLYEVLHQLGEAEPDTLAFRRDARAFRNSILTELPRGDYAFSLVRQLLYDAAEAERWTALATHQDTTLSELARKILQEERYHWMHGTAMVQRLSGGNEEGRLRMQAALDEVFPYANGLFEKYEGHDELVAAGLAPSEDELHRRWSDRVRPLLEGYGLRIPSDEPDRVRSQEDPQVFGGRLGRHTGHLINILDAIQLLSKSDPEAEW